ncbi:unnamed protein product [Diplocarpon coronariae]|uniref:Uncharacterized protein n=1 Tax=Diplocarpon coronariae TaxID=2795749 RepID=A0A218Z9S1_9HELO|nr:hypothetical protein B2J93_4101 [Marssonina coronariae]
MFGDDELTQPGTGLTTLTEEEMNEFCDDSMDNRGLLQSDSFYDLSSAEIAREVNPSADSAVDCQDAGDYSQDAESHQGHTVFEEEKTGLYGNEGPMMETEMQEETWFESQPAFHSSISPSLLDQVKQRARKEGFREDVIEAAVGLSLWKSEAILAYKNGIYSDLEGDFTRALLLEFYLFRPQPSRFSWPMSPEETDWKLFNDLKFAGFIDPRDETLCPIPQPYPHPGPIVIYQMYAYHNCQFHGSVQMNGGGHNGMINNSAIPVPAGLNLTSPFGNTPIHPVHPGAQQPSYSHHAQQPNHNQQTHAMQPPPAQYFQQPNPNYQANFMPTPPDQSFQQPHPNYRANVMPAPPAQCYQQPNTNYQAHAMQMPLTPSFQQLKATPYSQSQCGPAGLPSYEFPEVSICRKAFVARLIDKKRKRYAGKQEDIFLMPNGAGKRKQRKMAEELMAEINEEEQNFVSLYGHPSVLSLDQENRGVEYCRGS